MEMPLGLGSTRFWSAVIGASFVRLAFAAAGARQMLQRRVEIATPVTSLLKLAEGRWLMERGLSPYAGSAYHGSPLLLTLLGPIAHSSLPFILADVAAALLLRAIGRLLHAKRSTQTLNSGRSETLISRLVKTLKLELTKTLIGEQPNRPAEASQGSGGEVGAVLGDISALVYLANPLTITVCVGGSTSSFENMVILLSLYGALAGNPLLAAFGWILASHLAFYPLILLVPILLLLIYGADHPPIQSRQLTTGCKSPSVPISKSHPIRTDLGASPESQHGPITEDVDAQTKGQSRRVVPKGEIREGAAGNEGSKVQGARSRNRQLDSGKAWVVLGEFALWSVIWGVGVLGLCWRILRSHGGIQQMFAETHGFILGIHDLSPNLGVCWYFFTEIFDFFRPFFLFVFHATIASLVAPLSLRLHSRPLFLAFVLLAVASLLKSYPSVGDAALFLSLLPLFAIELQGMRFLFVLVFGFLYVNVMGPIMYNLWIWRGIGNSNFYYAVGLVYACIQAILIVESVHNMLKFDRSVKKALRSTAS